MLAVVPFALEHGLAERRRSTPVVWILSALIGLMFIAERVVAWDLAQDGKSLPLMAVHIVTFLSASWSCYADSALFEPWQLWSLAVIQPSWWQALGDLVMLWLCGRALERHLGSLSFVLICAILLPLTTGLALLWPGAPVLQGTQGLVCALSGYVLVRFREAMVPIGLCYWAVVFVGEIRLFTLGFLTLFLAYIIAVLFYAPLGLVTATTWWIASASAAGALLAWQGQTRLS
jgi:membrane associated rhomboid family serine protease